MCKLPSRRSIRLRGYDYSQPGIYFVTICSAAHKLLFGKIRDGEMHANQTGRTVEAVWHGLPTRFAALQIDAFIVMPNHIHGVFVLHASTNQSRLVGAVANPRDPLPQTSPPPSVGAGSPRPLSAQFPSNPPGGAATAPLPAPLGRIVAYFKYESTKRINASRVTPGAHLWQRGYYEHIVRSGQSLGRIRRYIADNPARWAFDRENPEATHPEPQNAWALETDSHR